ncbi:phage antirepressor [Paenarthrobacter nicotinovorans]|uniref:phage antirepressor n=1 Tax=Paenarthrobacter nicotinovorans TaxID=29320 RepID=UPI0039A4E7C0
MNTIQKFNFNSQQVRTLLVDGEPAFIANDLCAVLGLTNPRQTLSYLDEDEKGVISSDTLGGAQQMAFVSESGMYSLVLRSRKPEAKAFKRWITHEVLPAIRKTGSYGVPAAPQTYAEALRELATSVEAQAALEAKIAADAPKVLFADSVATSQSTILVGDLAKILRGNGVEVGANRLFALLREDGYLIRRQGTDWNMPTQKAMELGLFKVKETAVTHSDGHVTVSKTPKVTGKGQAYFINRYSPATKEIAA